jgi:hypothetical protein
MVAKSLDVLVALKLSLGGLRHSYAALAVQLGLSASEVHAAVRRLIEARLVDPATKDIRREALRNYLVHGVPHAFPARLQEITRGMPTAWAAPVMAQTTAGRDQAPPVWPDPDGTVQGAAVEPLYRSVPQAARRDPELYALLAWVDALRIGRARERSLAEKAISQRLKSDVAA